MLYVNPRWRRVLDGNAGAGCECCNRGMAWGAEETFAGKLAEGGCLVKVDVDAFFGRSDWRWIGHSHVPFDQTEAEKEQEIFQPVNIVHLENRWELKTSGSLNRKSVVGNGRVEDTL
jgi:hypothetical protein